MAEHKSPAECRRAAHVADLVAIVKDDWPAFWRSLPPREQWEAAKAMPLMAGPWEDDDGDFVRNDALGGLVAADAGHGCKVVVDGTWRSRYPDRASADAALRAAGWVLVDEPEEGGRGTR